MKIKAIHFDVEKLLEPYKGIDFSLFIESIPNSQEELSPINIISLHEPNEYFGLHDWVIQNKDLFSAILTWDDKVLNNCDNALLLPFGHTWLKPDQYEKEHTKEFKLAHLQGKLLKTYGHSLRHEITARKNELKIPTKFYEVYGDRNNIEDARVGKEFIFSDSQFGVVIENVSHRNFFSEKILDCFLLKTIPIYWGCSNIGDFFDIDGILMVSNIDDLIHVCNNLTEEFYESKKESIERNWILAKQFVNYEENIVNTIAEIFKENNLI
jgi:hypothetical protein